MGEGLVDLLFILFVAVAVIVQATAAKRKKQLQVMEQQRDQGQSELAETEEPEDSDEDLIPHEIWQEIGELAGGRQSAEPAPEPEPTSEPEPEPTSEPEPEPTSEPQTAWEAGLSIRPTTAVPEKSPVPDRSREVAARLKKDATPAPEFQVKGTEGERTGRLEWLFGGKDPEALRKAVLIREVLGPPLALREEEEGPSPD